MIPRDPTAVPVMESPNETAYKVSVVPLVGVVHVVPPSVVRITVPYVPKAIHRRAVQQETPLNPTPVGSGFCGYQPDCAFAFTTENATTRSKQYK